MEKDPLSGTGSRGAVGKGSGGDLRTSKLENFSSLYQDKLIALQTIYAAGEEKGPKTPHEDMMVGLFTHCTFNLNPRATPRLTLRSTRSFRRSS